MKPLEAGASEFAMSAAQTMAPPLNSIGAHSGLENHSTAGTKARPEAETKPRTPVAAPPFATGALGWVDSHPNVGAMDESAHRLLDGQGWHGRLILQIRQAWYQRQGLHRAEKSLTLQIKAICRRACRGDKTDAAKLYNTIIGKKGSNHEMAAAALVACMPFLSAREIVAKERGTQEKTLRNHAKQLPAAPLSLFEGTKGLDLLGFAGIIGEAGDLANYATEQRLWKRMGLAVMPDGRQRKHSNKDLAEVHGHNPNRRAVAYTVGLSLFMHDKGEWRSIYERRRAHTAITHPDWTKPHAHADALRVMTKSLLKKIWQAWRGSSSAMNADGCMSRADSIRREAGGDSGGIMNASTLVNRSKSIRRKTGPGSTSAVDTIQKMSPAKSLRPRARRRSRTAVKSIELMSAATNSKEAAD